MDIPFDLTLFHDAVSRALALDGSVYTAVQANAQGAWVALVVMLLAGLSEAAAQSLVLFINKVRPFRFLLSLAITVVRHLAGYLLWSFIVWLIGVYIFGRSVPLLAVTSAVGLAYAPRLFSFFTLIPFFGIGIGLLLSLWSMLVIVVAIQFGLSLELWQAVAASGMGWLALQVWQRTLGIPIHAFDRRIKNRAAGVPLKLTLKDIGSLRNSERTKLIQILSDRLDRTTQKSRSVETHPTHDFAPGASPTSLSSQNGPLEVNQ